MAYLPGAPNVFWQKLGGHIHMRVFINGAKMGDLVCRENEFPYVRTSMSGFHFYSQDALHETVVRD